MSSPLNPFEIALVRLTLWEALADPQAFTAALIEPLRVLSPGIAALLPWSIRRLVRNAVVDIQSLLLIVHEAAELRVAVRKIARRYADNGLLMPHDAHMFREALFLALESRLGGAFDARRRAALRKVCALISSLSDAQVSTADSEPVQKFMCEA